MIPANIQKKHLLQAIAEIDREGVPARQESRRYDLFYDGKPYPPKLLVRIANRLANGTNLPMLTGVRETNDFLTGHGFTIVLKPAALLPEQERTIEYSEWVLQQLLDYRETHPDFYFLTRTNKKRDLLEAGHWFPGTGYLHVALTSGKSGDQATKSVGFKLDFSIEAHPQASFVIRFKGERRPNILAFYHALLERLSLYGMQEEAPDYFILDYGEDVLEAMNLFLERDVPVFQTLLIEHELKETLGISPESFSNKLANVLQVMESGAEYKKSLLARLCWNTNGWVMPSGPAGKKADETSFEFRSGFAFEEWILDLDKRTDEGYHYGFLNPIDRIWQDDAGKTFDIQLCTHNNSDNRHYWIGELRSVEVIDPATSKVVEHLYIDKGWLHAMGEQLERLGLDTNRFMWRPGEAIALFNVRFLPEDVHIYQELIPFSLQEETDMAQKRYTFLKNARTRSAGSAISGGFQFRASAPSGDMPEHIVRQFEYRTVEHPYLHGKIQQGLYQWLKDRYGESQVAHEQPTGTGASRIDLAVRSGPNEYIFYEIKTYNSLMICIRIAIGQLMEYAFFPEGDHASRLIIVSYHKPDDVAMRYLENIRGRTGLPVYYAYFDLESGQLKEAE